MKINDNIYIKCGDCLELMNEIPDEKIDLILCDLPYGTTACKWDTVIPFEPLWKQYKRVIKDNGAIILFGSQPFTSILITSNLKLFKYEWIWEKAVGSNFATLKYQPMKEHENILVFSKKTHRYYPIMQKRKGSGAERNKYQYNPSNTNKRDFINGMIATDQNTKKQQPKLRNPSSVQYFNNRENTRGLHPTQKPVGLLEYLIKTYTNKNETVLDNCAGSFSTAIACINTNRKFIGYEKENKYFEIGKNRILNHLELKNETIDISESQEA